MLQIRTEEDTRLANAFSCSNETQEGSESSRTASKAGAMADACGFWPEVASRLFFPLS